MASARTLTLENFTGGVNLRDDPYDMKPIDLLYALDWLPVGEGGAVTVRDGDSRRADLTAYSGADRVFGIEEANRLLVLGHDGRLLSVNPATGAIVVLITPAGTVIHDLEIVEAVKASGQGPIFMMRDSTVFPDTPVQSFWNGTAGALGTWFATSGTLPEASSMTYAGNRVWMGAPWGTAVLAGTSNDSRLSWSDLGNPTAWPAANTVQLDPGDGEQLVAVAAYGSYVFAFKRSKCWVIYDLDTGANRPLAVDVGLMNRRLVAPTSDGLVFVDPQRGPMITDGSNVKRLPNGDKIGADQWRHFRSATYHQEHIYFTVADDGGSLPAGLFDYDMRTESWWMSSGWPLDVASLGGESLFMAGGSAAGVPSNDLLTARVADRATDQNGNPLSGILRTIPLAFGDGTRRKRLRQLRAVGAGSVTLDVSRDGGAYEGLAAILDLDAGNGMAIQPTLGVARELTAQFTAAHGARLDGLAIDFLTRSR